MKTNQVLTRKMGDFDVLQRTSDGMFNATVLLKQWNGFSGQKKQMIHYTENASTSEFVNALISEENLSKRNSVIIKSKANKGDNAGTWMHPLLFIDFAMWLNPAFKVKVLRFVYDQLIQYRNDAGDSYRPMCEAIARVSKKEQLMENIRYVAQANNWIVWNSHEKAIRNTKADESKLKELDELQKDIAKLIGRGFIKSYDALVSYLKSEWIERWTPKALMQ